VLDETHTVVEIFKTEFGILATIVGRFLADLGRLLTVAG